MKDIKGIMKNMSEEGINLEEIIHEINKSKKSLDFFNRIKSEFPNSIEVTNIDALIGMASASAK